MGTMKTIRKSKAGLALVAAAAIGLCIPAQAAPPHGHGRPHGKPYAGHGHRPPVHHHAPERRHDSGAAGVGLLLGIAALGALIIASQADAAPQPALVYAPPPPAPAPVILPPPAPVHQDYWYFCPSANLYYPYAQQCSVPWVPVAPRH